MTKRKRPIRAAGRRPSPTCASSSSRPEPWPIARTTRKEESMSDTIVWISGATGGIGGALLRHVPYAGARVINLDFKETPGLETVRFDLTDPESWEGVAAHFAK